MKTENTVCNILGLLHYYSVYNIYYIITQYIIFITLLLLYSYIFLLLLMKFKTSYLQIFAEETKVTLKMYLDISNG